METNNKKVNDIKPALESFDKVEQLNESFDGAELIAKKSFDGAEKNSSTSQTATTNTQTKYQIAPDNK